jgi:hypothetical protein
MSTHGEHPISDHIPISCAITRERLDLNAEVGPMTKFKEIQFPPAEQLQDETPLWRYISLAKLFGMLPYKEEKKEYPGTVFVPKISTLQKADPNEGKVSSHGNLTTTNPSHKFLNPPAKEFLASAAKKHGEKPSVGNDFSDSEFQALWVNELSARRCVWSWHNSESESVAQWRVYAKEGAAIKSTVGKVLNVLSEHVSHGGCYGRVKYVKRMAYLQAGDTEQLLATYPYFAKQESYEWEKEVRFVFRDDRVDTIGCSIPLKNINDFIKEVRVTPFLLPDEQTSLMRLLQKLLPDVAVKISSELSDDAQPRSQAVIGSAVAAVLSLPQDQQDESLPDCLKEL